MQDVVEWYVPGQVLYLGWDAVVTLESIDAVSKLACAKMDEAPGTVHILNDALAVRQYPLHVMQIRRAMTFIDHPTLDWLVSVTPNATINMLATIVPQMLTTTRSRAYHSVDLGLAHIRRMDETVDWSMALQGVLLSAPERENA